MKTTARSKPAAKKTAAKKTAPLPQFTSAARLQKLVEEELKDIYWAEKALTKALPKMIKNASSKVLAAGLKTHLAETNGQIKRLEKAFALLGKKAVGKKCEAMTGLIKEAEEIMEESERGVMGDAGIIIAGQKIEHYEIATYGTLLAFAQLLGLTELANIVRAIEAVVPTPRGSGNS